MKNIKILTANDTVNDCLKIEPNKHSDTDLAWLTELADKFTAEELQTMYDSIKTRREKEDAELLLDESGKHFTYCNHCSHQSFYAPHCTSSNLRIDCIHAVKKWLESEVDMD